MLTSDQERECCITLTEAASRASHDYQALLSAHQLMCSMNRKGDCYDNAMMETFFSTLKSECATGVFSTRAEARLTIFEYIEVWYNLQRRHSALAYQSPEAFEQAYIQSFSESTKAGESQRVSTP